MVPSPTPLPSDAVYETVKFHVFSYAGKVLAWEVGAVLSTITKVSVWLVAMSTLRGSFPKLAEAYVTVTSVRLSRGVFELTYTRSVVRSHCSNPDGDTRFQTGVPSSSTRIVAPGSGVKPSGWKISTPR